MNIKLLLLYSFLFLIVFSCTKIHPTGVYVCEKNPNDTTSENNLSGLGLKLLGIDGNCLYNQLEFKGKNTVVISGFGESIAESYIIDENYIKIKTDKSDLLFKIKDGKTLIGEGFAKGLYKKQ